MNGDSDAKTIRFKIRRLVRPKLVLNQTDTQAIKPFLQCDLRNSVNSTRESADDIEIRLRA